MTWLETLVAVAAAGTLAVLPRAIWPRWGPLHMLAAAFILYPSAENLLDFIELAPLVGRYTELQPYPVEILDELPFRILRRNLVIPLVGLGLVGLLGGRRVLRSYERPVRRGAGTWRRDLWLGLGLVPVVVLGELGALFLLEGPLQVLQTGDESALFANATVLHVVALSLAPAIGEELYYRGLLQGVLEQGLPDRHRVWLAIGIQGLVFALAHAGFTTVSHLLGPLIFGTAMGLVRSTIGLGACMALHASVNLAFFSVDPGAGGLGLQIATAALVLAGLVVLWREKRTYPGLLRDGPESLAEPPGGPA